jgi:8-oxo-dGTP diphosphatase
VEVDKPLIRVVAALVCEGGRYLITQRRAEAVLPLLWEFPGGRVESGETDHTALDRELRERLGVGATVGELISYVRHEYSRYTVDLHLYACTLESADVRCLAVKEARFVFSNEFERYEFTPADEASVWSLLAERTTKPDSH